MTDKTIIEINGVKLEVDLRFAKRIDHLKVGDTVKVLMKDYSSYKSFAGVIVGFDAFENLPTIIIAYMEPYSYSNAVIKTLCYNSQSKDVEIVAANEHDLAFEKSDILALFEKEIEKKQQEIRELESKKKYFLYHFNKFFKEQVQA